MFVGVNITTCNNVESKINPEMIRNCFYLVFKTCQFDTDRQKQTD